MSKSEFNTNELKKAHKKLGALKNPKRVEIIEMLSEKPKMSVTQIYNKLKITQPHASHHLKVLSQAGIIVGKRDGKEINYSIDQTVFENLLDCIVRINK